MKYIRKNIKIIILLISIIFITLAIISNSSYSKTTTILKEEYIVSGDTLWSIAEYESENNKYFEGEDIRNIISELKNINNIKNSNLEIGQKILIPEI